MKIRQVAVGEDLYVFTASTGTNEMGWRGNPNCIIDSHGFRPPTKPYFTVHKGQTVHFYVNRHAFLNVGERADTIDKGGVRQTYHYVTSVQEIAYGRAK